MKFLPENSRLDKRTGRDEMEQAIKRAEERAKAYKVSSNNINTNRGLYNTCPIKALLPPLLNPLVGAAK